MSPFTHENAKPEIRIQKRSVKMKTKVLLKRKVLESVELKALRQFICFWHNHIWFLPCNENAFMPSDSNGLDPRYHESITKVASLLLHQVYGTLWRCILQFGSLSISIFHWVMPRLERIRNNYERRIDKTVAREDQWQSRSIYHIL